MLTAGPRKPLIVSDHILAEETHIHTEGFIKSTAPVLITSVHNGPKAETGVTPYPLKPLLSVTLNVEIVLLHECSQLQLLLSIRMLTTLQASVSDLSPRLF